MTKKITELLICPLCGKSMALPECVCGHRAEKINGVWQLTRTPDMVTVGDGDKYIGYEHIGAAYSGERRFTTEEPDDLFAREISRITGEGFFLDLGCGDGCLAIPCAANGTKVIAGDISNTMLVLLQERAKHGKVSLQQTLLCRMNALEIPLADESVDTVVANSVLHLISNLKKVIGEIHRVLKRGGVFLCKDDTPGKTAETPFDNTLYFQIVNSLYREYWKWLTAYGIHPKKYSWKFDRNAFCQNLFDIKTETRIELGGEYELFLKDGFLPRFLARGFSDQSEVPDDLHQTVCGELLNTFRTIYGDDFETISFKGIEQDIVITAFYK